MTDTATPLSVPTSTTPTTTTSTIGSADRDALVEARLNWSALVEPADIVAAALVAALGPVEALDRLRSWAQRGAAPAVGEIPAALLTTLTARCAPRLAGLEPVAELERAERLGAQVLVPEDEDWPAGLRDLAAPPFVLHVRGALPPTMNSLRGENGPAPVAFVGSRTATAYGQRTAAEMTVHLADRGHPVVSGGAFGIDIAAHRAALSSDGATLAVMAGGLGHLYPRAHEDHFERISETGALLSELPTTAEPRRHRFLTRNRLIAALAGATVVVEAGLRSGALRTVRDALEIARPVGAVPGPVTSMMSAGCHELLRSDQATLVCDGEQVRELVTGLTALADAPPADPREATLFSGLLDGLSPHAARVLDALPPRAARDEGWITTAAGLSRPEVRVALGALELDGRVQRADGGWRRRPPARAGRGVARSAP